MQKNSDLDLNDCKYYYGGTLTFHSYYRNEIKDKLIAQFDIDLSTSLLHTIKSKYVLEISKEYHKVDDIDDLESPHYHFILYSNKIISTSRIAGIQKLLREKYGRSQFMIFSKLKVNQYVNYIKKDNERLMELTGQEHYKKYVLGPYCTCRVNREYVYEGSEDFSDEE